jgi:choline dehydrogenase-like flavoprotein
LAGHSVGLLFPFVGRTKIPPTFTKTIAINGYYSSAPDWSYPTGVIQVAGQMPIWEDVSKLMRPLVRFVATHALTCFYMTEALPSADSGFIFSDDKIVGRVPPRQNLKTFSRLRELATDVFRQAGLFVLARRQPPRVWHEVGTARLGADSSTSVVDPSCQVHGVEGLFVVDASVLPSAGAVNPALTIIALALRAGDHIGRMVLNRRSAHLIQA